MAGKAGAIKAGGAYVRIFGEDGPLRRTLASVRRRLNNFSASTARIGGTLTAAAGSAIVPMIAATKAFASTGDALQKMSARTGFSVESLSELSFAADQSGTSLGTVEAGARRMARVVSDAGRGMASARDALAGIGLSAKQLEGIAPEKQFEMIAEGLSRIPDASKRAALAQELLGRSGTQLLPMFANGAAGIEEMKNRARELGLTISTFDADQAARLTDAFDVAGKTIKRATVAIGAAFAPIAITIAESIGRILSRLSGWINQNRELVTTAALAAVAVGLVGTAILGVSIAAKVAAVAVGLLSAVWGVIGATIAAVATPIGGVMLAVVALGALFEHQTGLISQAVGSIVERFRDLAKDAAAAFGGIKDAIAAGDINAAWQIVVAGLKVTWSAGVDAVKGVWNGLVNGIAAKWLDGTATMKAGWAVFSSFIEEKFRASMSYVLGLLKAAQNTIARKLIELNPTLTVEEKQQQLQILDEDQQRAADADLSSADRNKEARAKALNDRLIAIETEYQQSIAALQEMDTESGPSEATIAARKELKEAIALAAASRKAADEAAAKRKTAEAAAEQDTDGSAGKAPQKTAPTSTNNREKVFFSGKVARQQAALTSLSMGPEGEQDRLKKKVELTEAAIKRSGKTFTKWGQTAAIAAASVTAALNADAVTASVPDQTQSINQELATASVPVLDDQTQSINQELATAAVPELTDQNQLITQELATASVPELPEITQTIRQEVIGAESSTQTTNPPDETSEPPEPLSRRAAYLKRQGREVPEASQPDTKPAAPQKPETPSQPKIEPERASITEDGSRRAAYLKRQGREVPESIQPESKPDPTPQPDTKPETPQPQIAPERVPITKDGSRRAAYLRGLRTRNNKPGKLSEDQIAEIDRTKKTRQAIADSKTQRPTRPHEDDGIGRAIAIARQQAALTRQGIGQIVATNQGELASILKFAEANQRFTARVNGQPRVPESINAEETLSEVRAQITAQFPAIRPEINRPELPGSRQNGREPERQLPVLREISETLKELANRPAGGATFAS